MPVSDLNVFQFYIKELDDLFYRCKYVSLASLDDCDRKHNLMGWGRSFF